MKLKFYIFSILSVENLCNVLKKAFGLMSNDFVALMKGELNLEQFIILWSSYVTSEPLRLSDSNSFKPEKHRFLTCNFDDAFIAILLSKLHSLKAFEPI